MHRLLYNSNFIIKWGLNLKHLVFLNLLNDKTKTISLKELLSNVEQITGEVSIKDFLYLQDKGIITVCSELVKLTETGKTFFIEDTVLSDRDYKNIVLVLNAWNNIPEATTHKLKLQEQPQTKTVFKSAQIVSSLLAGKLHPLIVDSKYHDKPVPQFEPMVLKDIIETIEDYGLKFKEDYYPNSKKNLPKNILDFFMNHLYFTSEFFTVYWDGVQKKKSGTASQLADWGVTPKTLLKVYDVMLSADNRNSESAKYILMKQLVLLHSQWEELVLGLDEYYLWKKSYRDLTKSFNYFTMDYVEWIGLNITGEKFPMYLQIKEDHEIYSQFRAWYADKYNLKLKVGVSSKEYLIKKTKKYMEGINE